MSETGLVLLVGGSAENLEPVKDALARDEVELSVQYIERFRTALARIAGGGVAAVLLYISSRNESHARDALVALRTGAPEIAIVVLCETSEEGIAAQVLSAGAVTYIVRGNWEKDLKQRVLLEMEGRRVKLQRPNRTAGDGTLVAFLGAKGGVGTTTVAVNVAAELASASKVTLAELRRPFGTLCHFFRPHRTARGLRSLLEATPGEMDAFDVESCLWPNRAVPGLSVLFAPEQSGHVPQLDADWARRIVHKLAQLSDTAIIDLAPELSEQNRAMLGEVDTLALVVERDALALEAAKAKLGAMEEYGIGFREAGLVIVNRVPLSAPLPLTDIESQLGLPVLGVIPPAADLCASAYRAHTPVVKFDPQSLMGTSLVQLAKRLSGSTG